MADRMIESDNYSMECPFRMLGCDIDKLTIEGVLNHLKEDALTHSHLMIELIHILKNEINGLKEDFIISKLEISNLKEELREKGVQIEVQRGNMNKQETDVNNQRKETDKLKQEIELLKGESEKREDSMIMTKSINDMQVRVNELAETVTILNVGTNTKVLVGQLLFTVDRFRARKATGEDFLSPYFYSHTNGYKLRLKVYPGGNGDGRGTHLSVYSVICKGEYDDILPWPCRHIFTFGITNQRHGGTHAIFKHTYATVPENNKNSFDKPINEESGALGYSKLISHVDLQSIFGLVLDDSVIVRCVVNAPA